MAKKNHEHSWVPAGHNVAYSGYRCTECEITRHDLPTKGVSIRDFGRSFVHGSTF